MSRPNSERRRPSARRAERAPSPPERGGSAASRATSGPPPAAERGGAPRAAARGPAARRRNQPTLIVGICGASGAAYGVRLVSCAVRAGRRVHLIITPAGRLVMADELGLRGTGGQIDLASIWPRGVLAAVGYTPAEDLAAPPASGSFDAEAMAIVPCSMNTVAALAAGLSTNLLQRAAYVALKEGRPLVVVPREMPLARADFENMARLAAAGAVVMPAMPGFYHRPRTVEDIVDFVVAQVLDRLGIAHSLAVGWPGCEAR